MSFPLSVDGEIGLPAQASRADAVRAVSAALASKGVTFQETDGDLITFRHRTLSTTNWHPMAGTTGGEIEVTAREGGLGVRYRLRVGAQVVAGGVFAAIALISLIVGRAPLGFILGVVALCAGILAINFTLAGLRFRGWLERAVRRELRGATAA